MIDNEIIHEATEAVEKGLDAGYAVEHLLRIVKSQKAEIERLQCSAKCHGRQIGSLIYHLEQAKSEAYREFAERFKWYVTVAESKPTSRLSYSSLGLVNMIDLVYKELTEKNDFKE